MQATEPVQRVRIYLSERDIVEGQPLYNVVLERLQQAGATGATVLRGIAGFGPGYRLRLKRANTPGSAPVVIEWVDRAERVARLLPVLDELLPNAMITVEDVQVYRATLRASGPFGERLIGAVAERDVMVAHAGVTMVEALRRLSERPQPLLPLLDGNERLIGIVTADVLSQRIGLPLRLLSALPVDEQAEVLARVSLMSLNELADMEPRTLAADALIPQAVNALVEWGLDALPVVERDRHFAGLFGVEQTLRAALDNRGRADARVRDAEPPTPVRLIMQGAVPSVEASAPTAETLARLIATPERFLVVLDEQRRPLGLLDDAHVLRQLNEAARTAWLTALHTISGPSPIVEEVLPVTTGALSLLPVSAIGPLTTRDDATRTLLDNNLERLIVVEESGVLAGLIARRGLLRALAQEVTS